MLQRAMDGGAATWTLLPNKKGPASAWEAQEQGLRTGRTVCRGYMDVHER